MSTPEHLQAAGRQLWGEVTSAYELEPGELVTLAEACRTVDELSRLEAELSASPMTTSGSRGQVVAHPLLREVRSHRQTLQRLLDSLAIPDEDETTGLSPRSRQAQRAARSRWRQRDQLEEWRREHARGA